MKKFIYLGILIFASVCFCDMITGIVKTTDNKRVIGAEVRVFKIRQVENTPVKTTMSDRYGKFKIEGLETGYYRILVSKKNFCDGSLGTIEVNQPKYGIANYEIVLKKPGSISGFVYGPDGQPVQSARIVCTRNNKSTITDNRGFYKIDGLEPGNFYIYAEAKGFVKNYRPNVVVEENKETAGINFTLSYAGTIKGVVVDAETGKVVENAMVECSGPGYCSSKTDSKGKFFIENLVPGRYDIGVYTQGYEYASARNISVVAKETVDVGEIKIKLRPKYFHLNTSQWLFTPGENVKFYFNAYRIPSVTINIYEIDLLNEINKSKGFSRPIKTILMSADISNKAPVLSKKIDISYRTPLTELYDRRMSAGMLPEGVYVCVVTPEGLPPQRQVFFVSDVGFISKTCDNKSVFTVFSISKGVALADISVYVFDNLWNLKQEIKTDSNGQFIFDESQKFLIISGKSFAVSDTVTKGYYGSDDKRMIYSYTDRPVYRPGHTIYFKAIPRIDSGDKYEMAQITGCQVKILAPDGSAVYETTLVPQKTGSISGQWTIPDEPPLGTYSIEFKTQGQDILSGRCAFKVLEYRKPEFSIEVKTDKIRYLPGEKIKAIISAQYYFGAPVKNADIMWAVYSKPAYDYYDFEDYDGEYEYEGWWRGSLVCSGNLKTDENGTMLLEIPTKKSYQQKETYLIEVKMTDLSRREITSSTKVLIVPGNFEISISTDKYVYSSGEEIPLAVSARYYEDNSPVIGKQFTISVSQETYDQKKKRWTFKELLTTKFVSKGEKTTIKLKPSATGNIRIDVRGIDQFHNIISATRYVWIAGRDYYSSWYGRKEIEIVSDKKEYEIGDTAKILINSSYKDLNLLFSIEGTKLFETKLIRMQGNSALIEIPVKQEYVPNIYISVCGVKNKNFISSSKPLKIACKEKFLNVEIIPEKSRLQPRESARYRIKITDSEGKGVSAEFSMGVVDESIYAISGELVPKIEDFFYGGKANRVSTSYSFSRWYYGGAGKDFAQEEIRRNFKDTAFWLPYAFTDTTGTADIQFNLPDNLTTWRTTIRAITFDTKVGSGINKVITTKPLIANLIMPRFMVEDDRMLISGVIHNYTGKNQKIFVEMKADGLDILDEKEKTIEIENGKSARVDWKVKVNSVKNAVITLFAQTSSYKDAMELTIPVFSYGADERYVFAGQCEDTRTDTFYMPAGTIPASIDAKSYIYPSLISGLFSSLDELAKYPYGCIEQTLSGFLPAVQVANTLSRIKKEDLDFLASDKEKFEEMIARLPKKVSDGLVKLYHYQNQDGGWGWWSNDASNPYTSGYVMFGLAHVKKSGYLINEEKFEMGKKFLKSAIGSVQDYNQKVFMLYSLVYAGEKNTSAIEDIYENKDKLHPYTMAQLCLILHYLGDSRAKDILNELCSKAIKPTPNFCYWQAEDGNYTWIHSNVETTAWALRAILATDPNRQEIPGILRYLVMKRQGGMWMSTKDTAMCLFAFTDYLEKSDELSPDYTTVLSINNNEIAKEKITRESIKKFVTTINVPPENLKAGRTNEMKIQKQGKGNLYYTHLIKCAVRDVAIPDFDSGFKVSRRYTETEPRKVQNARGEISYVYDEIARPLKSGERIRVEIKISGGEKYQYVMIEDPIPAGCEVVQEAVGDGWWYCRKEVRDEKVAFFTTFWSERERIITYQLRAETPGFYHVLPTKAQLMYLPEVWGRSRGNTLTIEQ